MGKNINDWWEGVNRWIEKGGEAEKEERNRKETSKYEIKNETKKER